MTRAGPGGNGFYFPWEDFVYALSDAYETVFDVAVRLLSIFMSPLSELVDSDSGVSSWFLDLLDSLLSLLGIDVLTYTPLQLMLGSGLPIIIAYSLFKYFKI